MLSELLAIIASTVVSLILGACIVKAINFLKNTKPSKTIWKLNEKNDIVICASNSANVPTGEYMRPATGIGQIQALASIVPSLNKAYGKVNIQNIYLSSDQLHDKIESNLILLGGPKNNIISGHFLDLLKNHQPIMQKGSEIIWRKFCNGKWSEEGAEFFHGEVEDNSVVGDFGLIIRAVNPFSSNQESVVVLLSGSHTYGTVAAAKYYTESLHRDLAQSNAGKSRNIVALVKAKIIHRYPASISLINLYNW